MFIINFCARQHRECMKREKKPTRCKIRCLLSTSVSTCLGHHYVHLQEIKDCVIAYGVLRWFCWLWLVAVVGRCLAGCEHYEGFCSTEEATIRCLLLTSVSTCFGHHYDYLQENKDRVTAYGVLRWFCWLWLVAVVGRCVVGCEHTVRRDITWFINLSIPPRYLQSGVSFNAADDQRRCCYLLVCLLTYLLACSLARLLAYSLACLLACLCLLLLAFACFCLLSFLLACLLRVAVSFLRS
jgi:hypothetical protein